MTNSNRIKLSDFPGVNPKWVCWEVSLEVQPQTAEQLEAVWSAPSSLFIRKEVQP